MEMKSPAPCPSSLTVRRNPPRRARPTPLSNIPLPQPQSAQRTKISSFPIDDILSIEIQPPPPPPPPQPSPLKQPQSTQSQPMVSSDTLKVYLRIRPLVIPSNKKSGADIPETKNAWPKNPKAKSTTAKSKPKAVKASQICITMNDSHSITLLPPQILQDTKRTKSEVYEGFSNVFSSESSQNEVYDKMVKPLVEDFLKGKSGMLAALGPSGSGKTHTVFGCVREPGMVPLALRRVFSSDDQSKEIEPSRVFYLSMFEISSEKGKSEKIYDLLQEGANLSMQQSEIKGLQEVIVEDAQEAEALIESGKLKRATATTNSNNQSSRSQCIINMRCEYEVNNQVNNSILTIVDLAGAEKERKTGNQGTRLLESNFINNTSMVFGLCLRSLLEHQKNPRKLLQKHFQSSLLTRYLRDYLEGKKRMILVLTVRPGEEDYPDTSFLLRQASPYMQIKFNSNEGAGNMNCHKRPLQTFQKSEQLKKRKCAGLEASEINEEKIVADPLLEQIDLVNGAVDDGSLIELLIHSKESVTSEEKLAETLDKTLNESGERDREHKILQGFSKAIWNVLKEYNQKLKIAQNEICVLKDNIANERTKSSDLENEVHIAQNEICILKDNLANERTKCLDLENEVNNKKSSCSCLKDPLELKVNIVSDMKGHESVDSQEESSKEATSVEESGISENVNIPAPMDQEYEDFSNSVNSEIPTDTHSEDNVTSGQITNQIDSLSELSDTAVGPSNTAIIALDPHEVSSSPPPTLEGENNLQNEEREDSPLPLSIITQDTRCDVSKTVGPTSKEESKDSPVPLSICDVSKTVGPTSKESKDTTTCTEISLLSVEEDGPIPLAIVSPINDDSACTVGPNTTVPQSTESKNPAKPKRRLRPASSLFLKDLNSLVFTEESDRTKGGRGEKKVGPEGKSNTHISSTSLLHLLKG